MYAIPAGMAQHVIPATQVIMELPARLAPIVARMVSVMKASEAMGVACVAQARMVRHATFAPLAITAHPAQLAPAVDQMVTVTMV